MTSRTHRSLGAHGEDLAAAHLRDDGLEILARNWAVARGALRGELDIVAVDRAEGRVVVVEVKTRRGDGFGGPLAAVTQDKQARIRRLAVAFLREAGLRYRSVRFDVVAVWAPRGGAPRIEHVEGAF